MNDQAAPEQSERNKQFANTFVAWAVISSWLMLMGMAAYFVLHTIWFLVLAVAISLVLRYFVMFRRFKAGGDDQR